MSKGQASSANLSEFARALAGLLDATGVYTRERWARYLHVTSSAISQWVRDKTIPRPDLLWMIYDTVLGLANVPTEPLEQFRRIAVLPAETVTPLGTRMAPTVWSYMTETGVRGLRRHIRGVSYDELAQFASEGSFGRLGSDVGEWRGQKRSRMALPGGAIPPDAKNRVARTEIEKKLERGLDGHPAMIRIDGPPQSGKSTLLRLVGRWASDRGMNVTYSDRFARESNGPGDFMESLARQLAAAWGASVTEEINSVQSLQRFVKQARRTTAAKPAIVIIDDLADLPTATQREVIGMCRIFQNAASDLNLSLLLALEPLPEGGEVDWFRSSRGYFHCFVPMPRLRAPEIESLFTHYPNADPALDKRITGLLGGQPYLTHLALEHLSAGQTFEDIQAEALIPWGPFDIHLQRLLRAIGGTPSTGLSHPVLYDRRLLEDMNIFIPRSEAELKPWTSDLYESFFQSRIQVAP